MHSDAAHERSLDGGDSSIRPYPNRPVHRRAADDGGARTPWPACASSPPVRRRRVDDEAACVTFIGHSTFLIQTAAGNILTDPMFSDARRAVERARAAPRTAPAVALRRPAANLDSCCSATITTTTAICRRCGARETVRSARGDARRQRAFRAIGRIPTGRRTRLVAASRDAPCRSPQRRRTISLRAAPSTESCAVGWVSSSWRATAASTSPATRLRGLLPRHPRAARADRSRASSDRRI